MDTLFQVDWKSVFVPSVSIAEIMLRGTLVYLVLFLFLRFLRRQSGAIGIADLLVVVLIADAAQNAMGSDYRSVTEGIVLVATIAFWDYLLDWLACRFRWFERFVRPAPLPLVENGKMNRRNMRQELITEDELIGKLREQGVEDISEVKKAYMEGDGHFSVITKQPKENSGDDDGGPQRAIG